MSSDARHPEWPEGAQGGRTGRVLVVAAILSLVAAGLLLWRRAGDAVFSDMVLAALAWCF